MEDVSEFHEALAELKLDGQVRGHVAVISEQFRGRGSLFRVQERLWLLTTWTDGRRERLEEDYPPYVFVEDLRRGKFQCDEGPRAGTYDVAWLHGQDRDRLWNEAEIIKDDGYYR